MSEQSLEQMRGNIKWIIQKCVLPHFTLFITMQLSAFEISTFSDILGEYTTQLIIRLDATQLNQF